MTRPLVNPDLHTITCRKCGHSQRSADMSRSTPVSLQAYVDRFSTTHRCGTKAKQAPRLDDQPSSEERWQELMRQADPDPEPSPIEEAEETHYQELDAAGRLEYWRACWRQYEAALGL